MSNYIQNTVMKDFSTSNQIYQKQQAGTPGAPGTPEQATPNAAKVSPQTPPQSSIDSQTVIDFINNLDIKDQASAQMLIHISSIIQGKLAGATTQQTISTPPVNNRVNKVRGTPPTGGFTAPQGGTPVNQSGVISGNG